MKSISLAQLKTIMDLFSFFDRLRRRSVYSRRESSQASTDRMMNGGLQAPVLVKKTTSEEKIAGMRGPASAATQELTPQAEALLMVLSIFQCDGIQEKLLIEGARYVHLKAYPKTRLGYEKARDELLRHTFVGLDSKKNELSIHNLVQDTVREKMDKEKLETLYGL